MATWLMILSLTASTSIDNLGVGVSYGIRNIRISPLSNLTISVICFLFSLIGVYFGVWISKVLLNGMPMIIGSFLFIIIGLRLILLTKKPADSGQKEISPLNKKHIMSGESSENSIGFGESVVLGIALSANAMTNGIGGGLLNLSPLMVCFAAAFGSFITVWGGVALGTKVANFRIGRFSAGQFGTLISGVILLIIAATSIIHLII
ncbi:Putative membrane protein ytaF [Bacillus freudenreichii]|nr:Putative membrane protein ytaF [Bacillus freudenreichii]